MPVRMILDTDIGSDVDDALALAFALRHPDIDLVAVTTVADDAVRRARIASKLLRIAGHAGIPVAPGVGWQTPPAGRRSWFGHEGEGLLEPGDDSELFEVDAVSVLLERTSSGDVEVATVGMQSNIAAALDRDATFADRIARLDVMGGLFAPVAVPEGKRAPIAEHNLMVDPHASARALNAGMPVMYTPLDVTLQTKLTRSQLERLRQGDELCRALAAQIDIWARFIGADDVVAVLHDPLTVACAVDRRFVTWEELPVTVCLQDGKARTFIDPVAGQPAEVIRTVDGPAFTEHWLETVLG